MICDLVKKGKKIGVTATGHKVIRNLLKCIRSASEEIRCMHRENEGESEDGIATAKSNDEAFDALRDGQVGWRLMTVCHLTSGPYDGILLDRGIVQRFAGF